MTNALLYFLLLAIMADLSPITYCRHAAIPQPRPSSGGLGVDLFTADDYEFSPLERGRVSLDISFEFPAGTCGLLQLRPHAVTRQHLSMLPLVVGMYSFLTICDGR